VKNWSEIFSLSTNSGVYAISSTLDLPDIEQSAKVCGLALFYIDLSAVLTKDAFLKMVSRVLKFPDYFGMNWDAFEDCLTDLSWFSSGGYILMIDNLQEFAQKVPRELKTAQNIFRSAAEFWREQGTPFFVWLVRENGNPKDNDTENR